MNRLLAIALFLAPLMAAADPETVPPNGGEQPPLPVTGAPVAESAVIPQAFPRDRYEASWKKNPFLLKVAVIAQVKESWATDYALTSIANMNGTHRVSIKNKKTGESKRLTEGGTGDEEFKIVAVKLLPDRKSSSVEIAKGGETATLTYDPMMTAPQSRGAVPGQPGVGRQSIPGVPVIPGQPMGNVPMPNMRTTPAGSQGPMPVPGGNYPRPTAGGNMPSYSGSASVNVAPPGSDAGAPAGTYPGTTAASRQGAVAPRTVASGSPQYMSTPNTAAPPATIAAGSGTIQNPGSVVINPVDATAPAPTTEGTTTSGTTTPVTRRRTLIPPPVVNP
jgi:hypothetical protein